MEKIGFGIEIAEQTIRFAQLAFSQGKSRLLAADEFALPPEGEPFSAATACQLRAWLTTKQIKVKRAVVGISGEHLTLRYLRVPPVSPQRLGQVVAMEFAQIEEKSTSPLVYGYLSVPTLTDDKAPQDQLVILALAHNSYLEQLRIFLWQAGISIHCFIPSAIAGYEALRQLLGDDKTATTYLVAVDELNVNLALCHKGILCFLRNADVSKMPVGLDNAPAPDAPKAPRMPTVKKAFAPSANIFIDSETVAADRAAEEATMAGSAIPELAELSLRLAKSQTRLATLEVGKVLLIGTCGDSGETTGLTKAMAARLRCPVQLVTDLPKTDLTGVTLTPEQVGQLVIAIGAAQLATQKEISAFKLISRYQQDRQKVLERTIFEYGAVALTVMAITIGATRLWRLKSDYESQVGHWQKKTEKLQEKLAASDRLVKEYQSLQAKLRLLGDQVRNNRRCGEALAWLSQNLQPQMYLTQIKWKAAMDNKLEVTIVGIIDESMKDVYSTLNEFRDLIEKSSLLKIVEEKDPKFDEEAGKLHIEMRLTVVAARE